MKTVKLPNDIKWATRQRLQYIEVMAYYSGVVSRSDVARAFGISDAAATKDINLYGQLAPGNLVYQQSVFGFLPTDAFQEIFADLSPAKVLPMISDNQVVREGPYGAISIYGIAAEALPLPRRLPSKEVLAQITRAIRSRSKLYAEYRSLSGRESNVGRILEPHSLVNTGGRWHVRAYNSETYDFRDFVLSRFGLAQLIGEPAESDPAFDDDWVEIVTLKLAPHPRLDAGRQLSLMADYEAVDGVIEIRVRRALIGYLLQNLSVDTTVDSRLSPDKYHLVVTNRDEVEPYAGWAFQQPEKGPH